MDDNQKSSDNLMIHVEIIDPTTARSPNIQWEAIDACHDRNDRFSTIMAVAHRIQNSDPRALIGLVRLLGRVIQARALQNWYNPVRADCEPDNVLFAPSSILTADGLSLEELKREVKCRGRIKLNTDIVLPWPWEPSRIARSLTNLRPGGSWGKWRFDRTNHFVELWLPWQIAWVNGGNHSIAAGIVYGVGTVMPELVYDISDVYNHVRCDGKAYTRVHDGSMIATVVDIEMAAIFEIGRLITEANR